MKEDILWDLISLVRQKILLSWHNYKIERKTKMNASRRSINIIIITIYLLTLLCGTDVFISNEILNNVRALFQIMLPTLIVLSLLFDQITNLKNLLKDKKMLIFMAINIVWIILTMILGISVGTQSIRGIVNFGCILLLLYLITNIEIDGEDRKRIIKHLFISALICSIYGIVQYIFGINLDTLSNAKYPGILGRINGTFYLATLYDKYMVLMFAFAGYNLLKEGKKEYILLFLLTGINAILTFARAGLIALFVIMAAYLVMALVLKKYKELIFPIILLIIAFLIPGFKYSFQSTVNYIYEKIKMPDFLRVRVVDNLVDSTGEEIDNMNDDSSIQYRKYYENIGKQFIIEYPISGIGVNNYSYIYVNQNAKDYLKDTECLDVVGEYMYPHNGYIQLAAEVGIIGMILFLGYIICINISSYKNNKYKYFGLLLLGLFLLGNFTETLIYNKQYMYLFVIMYGLYNNKYFLEENKRKKK
jgi:O-antigen ligase